MPVFLRTTFIATAIALIGFGLFIGQNLSDARWLALLGVAFVCLILATRLPLANGMPRFNKGLIRVTMLLACVFLIISAQLVRIQVVQQSSIYYRTNTDANGEVISNPRLYQQQLDMQRGTITDRNGVVLAETRRQDATYYRTWPVPSAYPVTGYYSPNRYGSTGIEAVYEQELNGSYGVNPIEELIRDLLGREKPGAEVQLTIDATLQTMAFDRLQGINGAIVVLDIKTGEVLVFASNPAVDPNALFILDDPTTAIAYWDSIANDEANRPFLTRANLGVYTPGSTFKTVTAGVAIDEGIAAPDTEFEDSGEIVIDGRILIELNRPDANRSFWTLQEAIMWSLNVVMAQVGIQIGPDVYWDYSNRLGFGTSIPFDLPVAQSQLANNKEFLQSPNALADTGFGQGQIQISPLHLAMLAAMWANDGTMMQPFIVSRVIDAGGHTVQSAKPKVFRQSVDATTADAVMQMMVATIQSGSAQHGQAYPYIIGGKTGTAELGGESTNSLFIGFIGDPEPRYAIAVVLEGDGQQLPSAVIIARDILVATIERLP